MRAVAAVNPRTVVVVNAASPVAMPWADDVAAVLQCWFAGEEWGNALADVLSGDVVAVRQAADDVPGAHRGHARVHELSRRERQGALRRRRLRRLPLVRRAPASSRGSASVTASRTRRSSIGEVDVDADARTRGSRRRGSRDATPASTRGAEVVQCYVADVESSVAAAAAGAEGVRQGLARPGRVDDRHARSSTSEPFAFWDRRAHDWVVEPGEFELAHRHVVARHPPARRPSTLD